MFRTKPSRPPNPCAPSPVDRSRKFVSAELHRVGTGFTVTMSDRRGGRWSPPRSDRTHSTADLAVSYIRTNHPEVVTVLVRMA